MSKATELEHLLTHVEVWVERTVKENRLLRTELAKATEALEKLGKGNRAPGVLAIAREALRSIDESGLLSIDDNIRS